MAEHSMCQPGRPRPQGESQDGSAGLADFHNTKSSGSRLLLSTSTRSPARRSSRDFPDKVLKGFSRKLPVVFKLTNRIEHIAVGGPIGDSLVNELLDERQHLGNVIGG